MKIKWYGHACFELESENGTKVLTDPYDSSIGYTFPKVSPDILTISHEHYDHNNVAAVNTNNCIIIRDNKEYNLKGISIRGFGTFHDNENGAKRGKNTVFIYNIDNMRVCHLGDLGHRLNIEEYSEIIKQVDILLIPVGGVYTIDSHTASDIAQVSSARVIIPMHYALSKLKFKLESVDAFIKNFENVCRLPSDLFEIKKDELGSINIKKVVVLKNME